jgi:hypothetical protein
MDPDARSAAAMRAVNPAYIPRNHLVEAALDAAVTRQDFAPFEQLLDVLSRPFGLRALRRATRSGGACGTDLLRDLMSAGGPRWSLPAHCAPLCAAMFVSHFPAIARRQEVAQRPSPRITVSQPNASLLSRSF